jgi:hypothetical protein
MIMENKTFENVRRSFNYNESYDEEVSSKLKQITMCMVNSVSISSFSFQKRAFYDKYFLFSSENPCSNKFQVNVNNR